ncbi:MAG: DUF2341 domain-containing protein [Bacteroidota bacterium]
MLRGFLAGFLVLSLLQLYSQNGPGGVGNTRNLEGGLVLWLDADSATFNGSSEVVSWSNLASVQGLSMQDLGTAFRPTFNTSAINGHAEVSFENENDALVSVNFVDIDSFPSTQTTVFIVSRHDNASQQSFAWATSENSTNNPGINNSPSQNRFTGTLPWNNTAFLELGTCCSNRIVQAYDPSWVGEYGLITFQVDPSNQTMFRDGIEINQIGTNPTVNAFSPTPTTNFYIGRSFGSNHHRGDISEFIVFETALNDAQLEIVDNYISSKFNIAIQDDYYAFDAVHNTDVAGIGQSGSDVHPTALSNLLGVGAASSLYDGDFVMFGHDNESIASWITEDQPLSDSNFVRLAREWRFDTTGTPGTVTISIDTASLPAKTAGFDFYYLFLDIDGDFTSGAVPYLLTRNDSVYEASGVSLERGVFATVALHRSVINFSETAFSGFETDGATTADFQVQIPYPVYRDVSIDYEFSPASTYNDNDPAIVSPATATVAAGNTSSDVIISFNGDTDDESDESVILDLVGSSAFLCTVGADSISTYTINDDDGADPIIQFDAPFSYAKKKTITIDDAMVAGAADLEDFPVLIRVLGADFDDIDSVQTQDNGFDIRFTYENSLTWLEHQIESYDQANKEFLAWVKLPTLSASEDTRLEMYYGNASVSMDPSTETVFDTAIYELVYHLDDADDATNNSNDGTLNGNAVISTGLLGRGLDLDGTNDYLIGSNDPSVVFGPTDKLSFSLWFRGTDNTAELISRMDPGQSNKGYSFRILNSGGARLGFLLGESFGGSPVALRATTSSSATVVDGDWHYLVGTYDGSTNLSGVNIYIDGNNTSITTAGGLFNDNLSAGNDTDPGIPVSLGVRDGGGSTSNDTDGMLDEARVMRTELSADWIATEFNNQNPLSSFVSYAIGESIAGFNIAESTDTVALTVALSAINAAETTVEYEILDVTTTAGNDYVVASGTVSIPANELSSVITIDLNNDGIDEADERFTVSLSNPGSNANLGPNSMISITILDDDDSPEISFADTVAVVNEGSLTNAITLNLSASSGSDVTVDFTVTPNTANSGSDYILPNGTLTIPAGNTSGSLLFNVVDDEDIEIRETFSLKLSNSVNAGIDAQFDSLVVTINDNDDFGIDGPGGIGRADGSGTLVMWSIADSAQVTGSALDLWPNEVGISELDLAPFGNQPTKFDNVRNGHSEISFANVNDGIRTDFLSASYFPYSEATSFVVVRHDNRLQRSGTYATAQSISGNFGNPRFSATLPWNGQVFYDIGTCCGSAGRLTFGYDLSWEGVFNIFTFRAGEMEGKEAWRNNTSVGSQAGTSPFTNHTSYQFYFGHSHDDNFQGDILEFVLFTNPLNTAQINIMNNYLAAKYDLVIEDDLYSFNTSHSFDVAGVGFEDADNFHNAAKTNFLTISNASTLGEGDYVLLGHDNGIKSSWITGDTPADISSIERLAREWRVDTTGTPGTISLSIDTTKLPAKSPGFTEYIILADADGDFTSGATIYPTSKIDGEYLANDIVVAQGTYIAVGTIIRSVEFIGDAVQDFESNNNLLTVSLSLRASEDVTVDYNITGTATQGADYSLGSTGTITIPAGNLSTTVDLGIIDESVEESDETIVVEISNPPSGYVLGASSVFTYTINDDDLERSVFFDNFKYSRTITIPAGTVGSDINDFPLYFEFTDESMKQLGDGDGRLENSNAFDIAFSSDPSSNSFLNHQLEFYEAATGKIAVWLRIPTLSSGSDTEVTFLYGNAGVTFDQSSDSVWRADFNGVWHMSNGDYSDASLNSNNGNNQGAVTTAGKVGQAASFDGLSNIEIANDPTLQFNEDSTFTISLWYNGTDVSESLVGMKDVNANDHGYSIFISNTNKPLGRLDNISGGEDRVRAQNTDINDGTWHQIVLTYDGTGAGRTGAVYVDGAEDNTVLQTDSGGLTDGDDLSPNVPFTIGSISTSAAIAQAVVGSIDEVRILNSVLSANEIAAEYSNQNDPSSFYTISSETESSLELEEAIGTVFARVRVDPADNTQATTIDFGDAASGTAVVGEDFAITAGTLSIPAGQKTGTFSFDLINDLRDEQDESFTLNISNPSSNAKLGLVTSQTYTIIDDDDLPVVSFVDTVSSANEGSSLVRIPVEITVESGNPVTVDFEVKSATATPGVDFVPLSGTLTIDPGELNNTISFQPIDDGDIESIENVQIRLFNPQNAVLSMESDTLHLVSIIDNDDLGFEGPGGVGDVRNLGGEGLLKLWLIADSASATGTQVTSWQNEIENVSVDYTMVPSSSSPNKVDNALNGHSVISFESTTDALVSTGTLTAASFPGNELSIFIVTETDNLSQVSYAYATDDSEVGVVDLNSLSASIPTNGNVEFNLAGDIKSAAYDGSWIGNRNIFTHNKSSDTILIKRNNLTLINDDPTGTLFTNHTNYNFYLGKSGISDPFQGDIAEFIMFSRDLNLAQINIVNNYLAAKYNLAIADDIYNFNVTHGVEVAGIGREDAENQHVAARAGLLTISNASDLDDGEYVLFGHNNAEISSWTETEAPSNGILRIEREWRVDTTGNPGTVTLAIDTTFLPNKPIGNEDYILLIDADGDFTSDASSVATTLVDGQYKASNVALNSGDYFTIGILSRTVAFDVASSNGFEDQAKNVRVNLSLESTEQIDLDYVITDGTATGGNVDYSLAASGTVSFLAGQRMTNIPLGIIDDALLESDETIEITLRNPPAGVTLGADSVHTYTINDDDNLRTVQFITDTISNVESVDSVYLVVELDLPDMDNRTTVLMTVAGGTAELSPAPDFTFPTDTIFIEPNETRDSLLVVIIDDVLDEDVESILFQLSSPTNAGLGDTTELVYLISDNDDDVIATFQNTAITVDEGASVAPIVVELNTVSGQDVEIDYSVDMTKSTAARGGVDFSLADGTITIPAGSEFATINVALTDDDIEEPTETLTIGISGDNVLTNNADTVVISIADNDALSGFYGPGGVGDSETNLLWLDSYNVNGRGVENAQDLDALPTWSDNSGNGFVFSATSATEAQQPTWNSDVLNGVYPAVTISNSQFGFEAPAGFTSSLSNYTMLTVARQFAGSYFIENNTTGNGVFGLNLASGGLYTFNGAVQTTGNLSSVANLTTWQFDAQAASSTEIYRNGTSVYTDNVFNPMSLANNFSIGNRYNGAAQATTDFRGRIGEVIIYNSPINTAQRIIVENYLAAKYGLAIANDLYDYQGIFFYDVVGIGSTASLGQHLEAMSDSLLLISNPIDLDSGEFVFTGHDNGDKLSWTTFEAPLSGSNVRRIAREWRVDLVGDPGNFSFKVDINRLPAPENGFTQYVVYVDSDGDFNNGAEIYQLDFSPTSNLYVSDQIPVNVGDYVTIGVLKPVVEFELLTSNGLESVVNPKVEVTLNFARDENVTVDFEATGGTALAANVDYLLPDGTLTIAPGNTTADIDIGVINDNIQEPSETIEITLANPSSNVSLGSDVVHVYTINDDDSDAKVEFNTVDFTVGEDGIDQTIELSLLDMADMPTTSDGSTYAFVSIQSGSTATFESDFDTTGMFNGDTLYFPNGSSSASFDLSLIDDAVFEGDETVIFRITGGNANIGSADELTVTITDNDTQPTVAFVETVAFGQESVSPVQIDLELSEVAGVEVEVNYSVTSTNATPGTDFDLTDGSVTFDPGEIETSILLTINNDALQEPGETVTITLSSPVNAALGSNVQFEYTILDDDNLAGVGPGGVGDNTTNILWLRGDDYDGVTWSDRSGNNIDGTVSNAPAVNASNTALNNQPSLTFDGTDDFIDLDNFSAPEGDFDVFFVYESNATTAEQYLFESNGGALGRLIMTHEGASGSFFDGSWNGSRITSTNPRILQFSLQSGSGNATVYAEGSVLQGGLTYEQVGIDGSDVAIGSLNTGAIRFFSGDIAEVVFYNSTLNVAQRKIVQTYLAERYGIAIADDLYDNPGYSEDVAGIGRETALDLHTEATSAGQLTVKDANSLSSSDASDDGDYMLFGHNGASTGTWNATLNAGIQKVDREWRFDVDGTPGLVTLEIDLAAFDVGSAPVGFPTLSILVSSNGDFDSNVERIYSLNNISGSLYQATGLVLNDNDVITLGAIRNISDGGCAAGCDFSDVGTWVTGLIPGNGDDVFVAGGDVINLSEDVSIGSLTIESGGLLNVGGFTLSLDQDCITLNGGTINTGSGEIEYSRAGDQCVTALVYNDLILSSSGRKFLLGDVTVNGNLRVTDNTVELDAESFEIDLGGNWTNQGTFTPDGGLVVLNGISDQSIQATGAGGENFEKVVVNKSSGSLLLESNVSIADSLELISGVVNLQTNDLTILNTEADHFNGSAASYLQLDGAGELFFSIVQGETYDLPIGDNDEYSPATFIINSLSGSNPSIGINLRDSKYPDISTDFSYISRYWTFNDFNISSISYDWIFTYTDADIAGGVESSLEPIKFDGSEVDNILDFPDYTVFVSQNQVSWRNLTSFSSGTAGVQDGGMPLPVELYFFEAMPTEDGDVQVNWATATETNNDFFTLERSFDGENFVEVATIEGAGNSSDLLNYTFLDKQPYVGISYYRLKQTDFDGSFTLSYVVTVNMDIKNALSYEIALYPNPAKLEEGATLHISNMTPGLKLMTRIISMDGKIVESRGVTVDRSGEISEHYLLSSGAARGNYLISIESEGRVDYRRVIFR